MPEETPELPVSPPEVQVEPSFFDKLKIHRFRILSGVLVSLVFGSVVFGAYKLGQGQVQPTPQPTPTPIATPTPAPTADWKTYTNTEYGYSVRYPNDWQTFEVKEGPETGIRVDFAESESFSGRKYWSWIKVNDNSDGLSVKQWVNGFSSQYSDQPEVMAGITREKEKIADVEAERVVGLPGMTETVSVFIPKEKIIYEIVLQKGVKTLSDEAKQTFNLMLSTFKFLGEESCVDTDTGESMTLSEARGIAQRSECVKEGSLKETYFCNQSTGTWWLDLDIQKESCAPACVVDVSTKKAEINWRCTGAISPD